MAVTNKTKSYLKLGSIFALLSGLFWTTSIVISLLIPSFLRGSTSLAFFEKAASYSTFIIIKDWSNIIAYLCFIAVIIVFNHLARPENRAYMSWVNVLILIGLSTALYEYVEAARNFLPMIDRMADMTVDVKKIYARFQFYNSDDFLLWHLTACIWFTIVSGLAWTNKMIPKYLVILGLLLGLSNGVAFIGIINADRGLIESYQLFSIILIPLWSIVEGSFLWVLSKKL
ncbi:MAG: hypothetical protein CMP39_00765 [Rickettsiales bacterium]|nr:hypothetical protein [Rickettsiales bacterium]|tara:strand:+ start:277 stop:963 length:687 start_codon:yes stop_codon:yes gene_type:complete